MVSPKKLMLFSKLCPGDILTLTAAVESLHSTYPGEFLTDVRTTCREIWNENPHLTQIADDDSEARRIECQYPAINHSNQRAVCFLSGYTSHLGEKLGRPLSLTTNRPHLYLSDDEKNWVNQIREHHTHGRDVPFWVVNAGTKSDYPAKQWPVEFFQEVIDRTQGRIRWAQIGECSDSHFHPDLRGVFDLRGQTDLRQLIRLVYHARGGLGGVTLLQHLCAAWQKPYVCLLGGREPVTWTTYPLQTTLHTIGSYQLPCCRLGGCWKSRVVPLDDGDSKNESLCDRPVVGLTRPVGECMTRITPQQVVDSIKRML